MKGTVAKTVGECDICHEQKELIEQDGLYYCKSCLDQAFYEAQQDVNAKHQEEVENVETRQEYNMNQEITQ
jgi:hypothetical protein